jgi:hypothetical protein
MLIKTENKPFKIYLMSWKPCRGGNVMLNKFVKDSHECYFLFHEATTIKDKSKIALRWLRAEQYFKNEQRFISFIGSNFIEQCRNSKEAYKPFIKAINSITHEKI